MIVFCRLKHPNIVELQDVYEDRVKVYLVIELWVLHYLFIVSG